MNLKFLSTLSIFEKIVHNFKESFTEFLRKFYSVFKKNSFNFQANFTLFFQKFTQFLEKLDKFLREFHITVWVHGVLKHTKLAGKSCSKEQESQKKTM